MLRNRITKEQQAHEVTKQKLEREKELAECHKKALQTKLKDGQTNLEDKLKASTAEWDRVRARERSLTAETGARGAQI